MLYEKLIAWPRPSLSAPPSGVTGPNAKALSEREPITQDVLDLKDVKFKDSRGPQHV